MTNKYEYEQLVRVRTDGGFTVRMWLKTTGSLSQFDSTKVFNDATLFTQDLANELNKNYSTGHESRLGTNERLDQALALAHGLVDYEPCAAVEVSRDTGRAFLIYKDWP